MMGNRSNLMIEVPRCSDCVIDGSDVSYSFLRELVNYSLRGGSGDDTLIGGSGSDRFVLSTGNGTITDFDPEQGDQLVIDQDLTLSFNQDGKHLLLLDDTHSIHTTLLNTTLDQLLIAHPELA